MSLASAAFVLVTFSPPPLAASSLFVGDLLYRISSFRFPARAARRRERRERRERLSSGETLFEVALAQRFRVSRLDSVRGLARCSCVSHSKSWRSGSSRGRRRLGGGHRPISPRRTSSGSRPRPSPPAARMLSSARGLGLIGGRSVAARTAWRPGACLPSISPGRVMVRDEDGYSSRSWAQ